MVHHIAFETIPERSSCFDIKIENRTKTVWIAFQLVISVNHTHTGGEGGGKKKKYPTRNNIVECTSKNIERKKI